MEDKKSLYHGGFQLLQRLNNILWALDQVTLDRETCSNSEMINTWKQNYGLLLALYKEVQSKLEDEDRKKHKEVMKEVTSMYESALKDMRTKKIASTRFLTAFDEWECLLRKVIEEKGLGMPDEDDYDDDLEEML